MILYIQFSFGWEKFENHCFFKEERIMLVLSRQRDESIIIGDNIVITVVDIRGDKVRLGIEAPKEVSVHRQEVWEAIQRENALKTNAPKDKLPLAE